MDCKVSDPRRVLIAIFVLLAATAGDVAAAASACEPLDNYLRETLGFRDRRGPERIDPGFSKNDVVRPYAGKDKPQTLRTQPIDEYQLKMEMKKQRTLNEAKKAGISPEDQIFKDAKDYYGERAVVIKKDTLAEIADKDTHSFVVFKDQRMVVGTGHDYVGGGLDMNSAGEIRVTPGAVADRPKQIDLNLKSGNYRHGFGNRREQIQAFRAAVRSILDQGIKPDKIILRDSSDMGKLGEQRILMTITPPYE